MDTAADEQVPGQRTRRRVLDHLVDLELVVAGPGLEEEVVRQVLDEIPRREDVVAVPGPTLRVLRQRALASGQEVVRVADPLDVLERAPRPAAVRRRRGRGAREHRVDRLRDELDVPELLGGDVRHQVVERPGALLVAEVERLERVVHERGQLAELAAEQLLHGGGPGRIRLGRRRQLDLDTVGAEDHRLNPFPRKSTPCTPHALAAKRGPAATRRPRLRSPHARVERRRKPLDTVRSVAGRGAAWLAR